MIGLVLMAAFGTSCADHPASLVKPREPVGGWRPAPLPLLQTDIDSGGVIDLQIWGKWILAQTNSGTLYLGKEGKPDWSRLAQPQGGLAKSILAGSNGFFVGATDGGKIWLLKPDSLVWKDLHAETSLAGFPSMMVQTMGLWEGSLVASLRGVRDTSATEILSSPGFSTWKEFRSGLPSRDLAATFFAHDSNLYLGTFASGIYRRSLHDSAWVRLNQPQTWINSPPKFIDSPFPRSFAWFDGKLWSGQIVAGLFYTMTQDSPWVHFEPDSIRVALPRDVYSLYPWRGKLFVAGEWSSIPMVYDPGLGTWKSLVANFCLDEYGSDRVCPYFTTLQLAATSDTLYAASGGMVLKIGWPDIP